MDVGRPFSTLQKICDIPSLTDELCFLYNRCFDFFQYSFPSISTTKTLSSALPVIPGTMSFSDKVLSNLTSTTLHGRAFGRPLGRAKDHRRDQEQSCQWTQRILFRTAFLSSNGSAIRSLAQNSVPPLNDAPLLETLYYKVLLLTGVEHQ